MIKILLSICIAGLFYFVFYPDDIVIVKFHDLSKSQEYEVPFKKHEGWARVTYEVIENTALDSVYFFSMIQPIAPGWVGVVYSNDHYNVEPFKGVYKPIGPVKGSITIKYSVKY